MSLGSSLHWLRRSSTMRLVFVLSAIFAAGLAVSVFAALIIGTSVLERRVDTNLRALASAADLSNARGDAPGLVLRSADDIADLPRAFERVARRGGGTIDLEQDYRGADTWRLLATADSRGNQIIAAVPLDDSEDALELLGGVLWTTVGVVIALSLLVGLVAGSLAQRRLGQINKTLTALANGDLAARTGIVRAKDDLSDIAYQLDLTAGELERLVLQTRHLSASLAHDLRTPLARLRSRLEVLPSGAERNAALDEAEQLSRIFDAIMRVARIEAAQGTDGFETVDLRTFAQDLHETFAPVVEDAGKALKLDLTAPENVFVDRQMLVQAVANLIQNAILHGGSDIALMVQQRSIGVVDNGRGVDPSDLTEIIKPMVRLDASRKTDGTGLGLALVRAVADRHRAELVLTPHQPTGLSVMLKFTNS